jgi:four helix bundle protein
MLNVERVGMAAQHRRGADIQERTTDYAVRAVRLFRHLQQGRDGAALVIGRQYLRSATSIGANLVEAQGGESRRDFIHKCCIAQKEARESRYWLALLLKAELVTAERLAGLMDETDQIIAILTRIVLNAKSRKDA